MLKALALAALGVALALPPEAVLAEQGASSSYGGVGWRPVIPIQALTPRDRAWNHNNQSNYQAENSTEWLRQHGKGLFPLF